MLLADVVIHLNTMIYKNYSNELQIYTPQQLIKHLDSIEKEHA